MRASEDSKIEGNITFKLGDEKTLDKTLPIVLEKSGGAQSPNPGFLTRCMNNAVPQSKDLTDNAEQLVNSLTQPKAEADLGVEGDTLKELLEGDISLTEDLFEIFDEKGNFLQPFQEIFSKYMKEDSQSIVLDIIDNIRMLSVRAVKKDNHSNDFTDSFTHFINGEESRTLRVKIGDNIEEKLRLEAVILYYSKDTLMLKFISAAAQCYGGLVLTHPLKYLNEHNKSIIFKRIAPLITNIITRQIDSYASLYDHINECKELKSADELNHTLASIIEKAENLKQRLIDENYNFRINAAPYVALLKFSKLVVQMPLNSMLYQEGIKLLRQQNESAKIDVQHLQHHIKLYDNRLRFKEELEKAMGKENSEASTILEVYDKWIINGLKSPEEKLSADQEIERKPILEKYENAVKLFSGLNALKNKHGNIETFQNIHIAILNAFKQALLKDSLPNSEHISILLNLISPVNSLNLNQKNQDAIGKQIELILAKLPVNVNEFDEVRRAVMQLAVYNKYYIQYKLNHLLNEIQKNLLSSQYTHLTTKVSRLENEDIVLTHADLQKFDLLDTKLKNLSTVMSKDENGKSVYLNSSNYILGKLVEERFLALSSPNKIEEIDRLIELTDQEIKRATSKTTSFDVVFDRRRDKDGKVIRSGWYSIFFLPKEFPSQNTWVNLSAVVGSALLTITVIPFVARFFVKFFLELPLKWSDQFLSMSDNKYIRGVGHACGFFSSFFRHLVSFNPVQSYKEVSAPHAKPMTLFGPRVGKYLSRAVGVAAGFLSLGGIGAAAFLMPAAVTALAGVFGGSSAATAVTGALNTATGALDLTTVGADLGVVSTALGVQTAGVALSSLASGTAALGNTIFTAMTNVKAVKKPSVETSMRPTSVARSSSSSAHINQSFPLLGENKIVSPAVLDTPESVINALLTEIGKDNHDQKERSDKIYECFEKITNLIQKDNATNNNIVGLQGIMNAWDENKLKEVVEKSFDALDKREPKIAFLDWIKCPVMALSCGFIYRMLAEKVKYQPMLVKRGGNDVCELLPAPEILKTVHNIMFQNVTTTTTTGGPEVKTSSHEDEFDLYIKRILCAPFVADKESVKIFKNSIREALPKPKVSKVLDDERGTTGKPRAGW